jgi:hypothetical protein
VPAQSVPVHVRVQSVRGDAVDQMRTFCRMPQRERESGNLDSGPAVREDEQRCRTVASCSRRSPEAPGSAFKEIGIWRFEGELRRKSKLEFMSPRRFLIARIKRRLRDPSPSAYAPVCICTASEIELLCTWMGMRRCLMITGSEHAERSIEREPSNTEPANADATVSTSV